MTENVRKRSETMLKTSVKVSRCSFLDMIVLMRNGGVEKRKAARNAEADFFLLLRESDIAKAGTAWKEVSTWLPDASEH